jgi:two-component system sensor histidine kinase/response regulator
MAGDRERSLEAGMNAHITKPIDPDELFDMLLRWLPDARRRSLAAPKPPDPQTASGSVPPDGDDWLYQIAALDAADGLRRVLGRREAYINLLRRFARTQASVIRDIRTALVDGRHADAERAAHTLKGVAGSLGARQLQGEAGAVEAALRRGLDAEELKRVLEPAERTLEALVSALLAALPPEVQVAPPPSTAAREALQAAVRRLEELLSQDDMEAVDVFDAAAPMLTAAFGERAGRVGTLVRDYCFEDALAALREAVNAAPE